MNINPKLITSKYPHRPIDLLQKQLKETAQVDQAPPKQGIEQVIYDVVARYYAVMDRGSRSDIAEIVTMFAKDGLYNRAGKQLQGRQEILSFYTTERTLKGQHQIQSLVVENLFAHVTGVFEGKSVTNNEPRRIEFADTWHFDLRGYVSLRHTYLSQGHQMMV